MSSPTACRGPRAFQPKSFGIDMGATWATRLRYDAGERLWKSGLGGLTKASPRDADRPAPQDTVSNLRAGLCTNSVLHPWDQVQARGCSREKI